MYLSLSEVLHSRPALICYYTDDNNKLPTYKHVNSIGKGDTIHKRKRNKMTILFTDLTISSPNQIDVNLYFTKQLVWGS